MKPTHADFRCLAACIALVIVAAQAAVAASPLDIAQNDADRAIDSALRQQPGLPRPYGTPKAFDGSRLSLDDAVRIALANNPGMVNLRQSLCLAALGVVLTRHDYEPQLSGVVSSVLTGYSSNVRDPLIPNQNQAALTQTLGLSQRLPFGGSISISAAGQVAPAGSQQYGYSPSAGITLTQPLLRGAGYGYNTEELVSAKRSLVYALRDFKLRQEDFVIDVANQFLSLITLQRQVRNLEKEVAGYDQLYRRAQALYSANWISDTDFLTAEQQKLQARQELGTYQTQFQTQLQSFKLTLNIPAETELDLVEIFPGFENVKIDPARAVTQAVENRVDLKTAREKVEDSVRRVRMAKQDLLPDLDLNLNASTSAGGAAGLGPAGNSQSYSAILSLSLPFDRTAERYHLFSASQDQELNQRQLDCMRQFIAIDIRNDISTIQQYESSVRILDAIIDSETKRHAAALYRFDRGLASGNDVADALASLTSDSNQRLSLLAQHFVGQLQLRRNLGQLDVNQPLLASGPP